MSDLVKDNLCSNDPRSTFYIELDDDPRPARVNCFCENCFSGKDKLAVRIAELEAINAKNLWAADETERALQDRIAEMKAIISLHQLIEANHKQRIAALEAETDNLKAIMVGEGGTKKVDLKQRYKGETK